MKTAIETGKLLADAKSVSEKLAGILKAAKKVLSFSLAEDIFMPSRKSCISIERSGLSTASGARILSFLDVRGQKRFPFETTGHAPSSQTASALDFAFREIGSGDLVICIPGNWVAMRTVQFPSSIKENLAGAISYEMDRLMPFEAENAYYDYKIINEDADKVTVLVAAAKAEMLNRHISAAAEKGLNVTGITASFSGYGALCKRIYNTGDFVFVRVENEGYEGIVYKNGVLRAAFTGAFTEDAVEAKSDIVIKKLDSVIKGQDKGFSPLVVYSLGDKTGTAEFLADKVPYKTQRLEDTRHRFLKMDGGVSPATVGSLIESLTPGETGLNLLSRGHRDARKTPLALTVALFLALAVTALLNFFAPITGEVNVSKEIERQYALKKDEVKKVSSVEHALRGVKNDISTIHDFKWRRPMTHGILRELSAILPEKTWVTRMRVSGPSVEIDGYAPSATALLPKLEASGLFKKVEFASPIFRDVNNGDRFFIKMEIEEKGGKI